MFAHFLDVPGQALLVFHLEDSDPAIPYHLGLHPSAHLGPNFLLED
jgi:hypothetical protein